MRIVNKMAGTLYTHYRNPDENFVMRGGLPNTYRSMPGFLSNSMLTDTSKNLSQHNYNPGRYGDDPQQRGSLRIISRRLNRVSDDLRKSLLLEEDKRAHRSTDSYTQPEHNETSRDEFLRYPPSTEQLSQADWYTKPVHLLSSEYIPMSTDDLLAARYFPVTLGEAKSLEIANEIKPGRGRSRSRSKTAGIRQRSLSVTSQRGQIKDDARRLDNTYFLTEFAPHIKMAEVAFTSPFSDEIAKLRMEKLRIEEKQYLELKRQLELEKIRGPKPKWYELKTPEFHYEAGKNNELLRNSGKWDELLKYRESLVDASRRLHTALQGSEVPVY